MKFIVSSAVLLKNLQAISGVLSSSSALPILENFLFELENSTLRVTASDLETTMTVSIPLSLAENGGSVAVPSKILLETLKTLPDIPITFNCDTHNHYVIELMTGEGKYKLSGQPGDNYPRPPEMEEVTSITVDSGLLAQAISKTVFATGNDELRPVMSGVFCELTPDDFTFVATDAHKLVRYRRTDARADDSVSFIFPKKPLNQLKSLFATEDAPVKLDYNNTNASFTFKNFHLVCRLIDGKYPNYEAVIPRDNPKKLLINRVTFLNAIRRVSIFANQSTHQIRVTINGQELQLEAEDIDYASEARERLACSFEGEDIEIGFNSRFLVEMLNNIDSAEISLEMSEPNRAGILLPVSKENDHEQILMLVMPVMLA
ncbi:MAG: DNA polymerase III subunit beta [Bacteroidales bacterium]|nr:DNA polymerase III subunit beta [Bacteroidales bacterium]MDZ4205535.1 DNA polymerase III subunit beta [Bacteroidales bacterium]